MPDGVLDLSSLTNLISLTIHGQTISEEHIKCVCSSISFCIYLEKLELKYITLHDGVLDLRGLTNQTSLTLLEVTMSEKCSSFLCSSISSWTHLESLELTSITLFDGVLDLSCLTNLSCLTLKSVTMSKKCSGYLCSSISKCIHLEHLKLGDITLHDGVLVLSSLTNLSSLTLESVTMSEECNQYLCSSSSFCTKLECLELNGITLHEGVLNLSSLTNLTTLKLDDVTMCEECSRYLCSSICFCTYLERLVLHGIKLHDGALDLRNLTNLTFLKLDDVTMTEECSRSLYSSIGGCTHLECLVLFHIRLHDCVLDFTGLSGLEWLWLYDVTMSAQCKQTLQKSLKQCRKLEPPKVESCKVERCYI